jgi:hypothetical protein
MNPPAQAPKPPAASRWRARRCRIAGVILLALGLGSAGVVYWLGTRTKDYSDDLAMIGFNRSEQRQMGILYGKQGELIEDLTNSLKRPGTQALIIGVIAAAAAAGCFFFARILDAEAKDADDAGPPASG